MIEVRFHGRGGQGAVTAAQLLAIAAFECNKHTQAFPNFGVERRGAPVEAYCRIDDKFINLRTHVYNPNVVVILDPRVRTRPYGKEFIGSLPECRRTENIDDVREFFSEKEDQAPEEEITVVPDFDHYTDTEEEISV